MVYGRTPMRRSTRRSSYRKRSYHKKAVAVPKVKRTARKYTRSNALAINRLSKKVQWLSEARYGAVQRNFQTTNAMTPLAAQPILTDIMDFTCRRATTAGANFGQFNSTGTAINNVGNWTPSTNLFHAAQNLDLPDTGKYLALSCHVTLRFQAVPSITDCRVRVDLFSVKASAIPTTITGQPIFAMPSGLLQLINLANPELNKLGGNPYLKVWATKWLYLSSSRNMVPGTGAGQAAGPAVTGNSGYLSFNIKPKKGKLRTQEITAPWSPGDPVALTDGNYGPFNIPQADPLFLLISSSDTSVTGTPANAVTVQMSRTVRWRDPIGQSQL